MIIDPTMRNCVAFLVQESEKLKKVVPLASAFFVTVNMEGKCLASYLVTARHNVEYARNDMPLYLRINTVEKKFRDLPLKIDDFIQHPTSDVAVLPMKLPEGIFASHVPYGQLLRSEMVQKTPPQEGASVCIPSLFAQFYGRNIMYPLVRTGRIALVPEEKIVADLGPEQKQKEVEGYLIECLSWGGCSGAPVFVDYLDPSAVSKDPYEVGPTRVLGIISSHFDVHRTIDSEEDMLVPNNGGIAVVVPAQGIVDLIKLDEERRTVDYKKYLGSDSLP
jgi:hypothetical protein